jgi:hypothetical protein
VVSQRITALITDDRTDTEEAEREGKALRCKLVIKARKDNSNNRSFYRMRTSVYKWLNIRIHTLLTG